MPLAVAFAGRIGSGKTEVTNALAKRLGWSRASFGDYVRRVVFERGLPSTRENLQLIGTELLQNDIRAFCSSVISSCDWNCGDNILIDGLRHSETIPVIRELVRPAELKIVFLTVSDKIRAHRLGKRENWSSDTISKVEAHSSEWQVTTTIRNLADLEVDSDRSVEIVEADILRWIRNQQRN